MSNGTTDGGEEWEELLQNRPTDNTFTTSSQESDEEWEELLQNQPTDNTPTTSSQESDEEWEELVGESSHIENRITTSSQDTDEEWQEVLTTDEYEIRRERGTEPRFTREFQDHDETVFSPVQPVGQPVFVQTQNMTRI